MIRKYSYHILACLRFSSVLLLCMENSSENNFVFLSLSLSVCVCVCVRERERERERERGEKRERETEIVRAFRQASMHVRLLTDRVLMN